jgi:hypothetical protein
MYPHRGGAEEDLLRFFVAVLNSSSCFWYIATHSQKYRGGYIMLEPKTLSKTPVPDPSKVSTASLLQLIQLTDKRLLSTGEQALVLEEEIDNVVAELYGLTEKERRAIGMEY